MGAFPGGSSAAVFWLDNRVPYEGAELGEREYLLNATGGIVCADGTTGTGFVVDISSYVLGGKAEFQIVATSARVLFDGETGESRGTCAFRPAALPGEYLRLGENLAGAARVKSMDSNDWAFARVEQPRTLPVTLRIDFGDADAPTVSPDSKLWAVGYVDAWGQVGVSSRCRPDEQLSSSSRRGVADAGHMMIHNCDILGSSRGGPLAIRENDSFRVVAIHAGESQEEDFGDLTGIPFDPQRNFFNFSRRLDKDLESKLVAFISRFAYVKSPTVAIKAKQILVRNIQDYLNRLGFNAGKEDGLLGRHTRDAIRSFQTTLGITPTGRISEELLLLLKARAKS